MKKVTNYNNKKVLVMGFGISGLNAAYLLRKLGAEVVANDQATPKDPSIIEKLENDGIKVLTGSNPLSLAEDNFDVVVKNPGIPYDNPLVAKFVEKKTPIITEAELGWQIFEGHLVSVTGSNGKTTTTTLTQLMIAKNNSHRVKYAGNIGVSFSKVAAELGPDDTLVTELSSFQLLGTPTIHPHIAIITNIFSNHLDYHKTRENYINAKLNITRNQTSDDYLIVNWDRDEWQKIAQRSRATIVPFSRQNKSHKGSYEENGKIYWRGEYIMDAKDIRLIGPQNVENALAAIAAAKLSGVANQEIIDVLTSFSGVRHRLQYVTDYEERRFYNDSKSTDIEATEVALQGFEQPVILLAGGLDRGYTFERLVPYFKKHVKAIVVFGQCKDKMKDAAEQAQIPTIIESENAITAVPEAWKVSEPGDVILLSPANASWDQFPSFEVRGDKFIEAVNTLIKEQEEK
ncbi:UDP-N-acetylmuramoyl-L-alanine--D-glutamate ligase [Limosilactobacillus fastidiosus]|uniref:UDP-N-acetylmuramoylalanine--D-glutamate ligase n=1 Tax=Limosilactobacillus fastidiosus TaxID=2759855 RepID=A0A7W3TXY1_9LACO|nr:UDP-N-acetylmuramoyl-L-alanine--D-glutamate ligase [Limosilactobacillus fastidiosus]MBB1062361.1 UDP-N-acetylmuramoyl-L-alanine--D-glutamate ligase [Limosilactobacillus fastidiosus]MBB1085272.1 UDP-N-acetylmuramoyl-L-alanine--D-glutamate ligase [Limosilactobacillus fastidiosus]MCD7083436.1 UDP-N-acetylmuramoyl-L-alanine--D-glutamate ligase [Limosilactobacillus fastidiosus]MCD7085256.1 UDP-N-acetylmuramoyl-L-alanine--D-glutamate ligase [Limosilactobacillus fastidiosus]MCD7115199.1 UDP-N-acet